MLEPYKGPSSRFDCPNCGAKKEFTRYIDNENKYYADNVGRCNRELNCGYHLRPSQYFKENPNKRYLKHSSVPLFPSLSNEIDFLDVQMMKESVRYWRSNNFAEYLSTLVGWQVVKKLFDMYYIGTSKHWQGATVFWQVDAQGRPRQAKVMHYNPESGRRTRSLEEALKYDYVNGCYYRDFGEADKVYFAGKWILGKDNPNLKQCFFGEHLLYLHPNKVVCIVESEKTALIASLYMPHFVWLSTGGKNGCKWSSYEVSKVLEGRKIKLWPDLGCYEDWSLRMKVIQKNAFSCDISISSLLEESSSREEKQHGYDLADFLLKRDSSTGWAINDSNYPIMWDL